MTARHAVGPRAFWLATDGRAMPVTSVANLASAAGIAGEDEVVAALRGLQQGLAGAGWTTLTLTTPISKTTGGSQSRRVPTIAGAAVTEQPDRSVISLRWPPTPAAVRSIRVLDAS